MDTNQSALPIFTPSDEPLWTNHWGNWISSNEPTTGVISCHNLEHIYEETDYHAVTNVSYDRYLEYGLADLLRAWQQDQDDDSAAPDDELLEQWRDQLAEQYEESGDEYRIGSWRFDESSKQWEINRDESLDDESAYAAIVNYGFAGGIVQVLWSRFVTRGALCSPCLPGQVDLDTEGDYIGYDLPLSFYGDMRENTNPQMRYWITSNQGDDGGSSSGA